MARNLSLWDPFRDMMVLRNAMERVLDETLAGRRSENGSSGERWYVVPPVDAWEDDDTVVIEMSLAGVDPKDVEVTFENDCVVISGEIPPRDDDKTWVMRERPHGAFRRRFDLSVPIDADAAKATFHDGILELRLPKSEAVKPKRIAVTTA